MKYLILIIPFLVLFSCKTTQPLPPNPKTLKLLYETHIDIPEPSGLSFDNFTNTLWCVSDSNGKIYNLDTLGVVINTFQTEGVDLEGIAFDSRDKTLWITDESSSNLINVSTIGNTIHSYHLDFVPAGNSGLEGVCIDSNENFCILKEKNNGYFYKLDKNLNILKEISLDFAEDFSGIYPNNSESQFWIVSDQSQELILWDSSQNLVLQSYNLNFPKAEGIVYLADRSVFYIVSDSQSKLYKFKTEE